MHDDGREVGRRASRVRRGAPSPNTLERTSSRGRSSRGQMRQPWESVGGRGFTRHGSGQSSPPWHPMRCRAAVWAAMRTLNKHKHAKRALRTQAAQHARLQQYALHAWPACTQAEYRWDTGHARRPPPPAGNGNGLIPAVPFDTRCGVLHTHAHSCTVLSTRDPTENAKPDTATVERSPSAEARSTVVGARLRGAPVFAHIRGKT